MHSLLVPASLVILNVAVFALVGCPRIASIVRTRNTVQNLRNAGLL